MPFLIDGHNLIGKTPGLHLDDPDDEQKLIVLLRDYLVRARKKGTVFFDRGAPGGARRMSNAVLEVRFASAPLTADELIMARLHKEKNPRGLTIVTSDTEIVKAARRVGARVKAAGEFARELLDRPQRRQTRESNLDAREVEAWEEEFRKRTQT